MRKLAIAVVLAPVWIIALVLAVAALDGRLAGVAALAAIAVAGALGVWLFVQQSSALRLERIDGDGIVRLGNVHSGAGQAIVDAAATG
jgi:uncharacterized protein (DUF58 family)